MHKDSQTLHNLHNQLSLILYPTTTTAKYQQPQDCINKLTSLSTSPSPTCLAYYCPHTQTIQTLHHVTSIGGLLLQPVVETFGLAGWGPEEAELVPFDARQVFGTTLVVYGDCCCGMLLLLCVFV